MVISAINPVHSVFYLVLTFINTSLLLLVLGVEFLSILFIIVYIGAIAVLFLFVVMMLNIKLIELIDNTTRYIPIGFIVGVLFLTSLSSITDVIGGDIKLPTVTTTYIKSINPTNIELIGNVLYTNYFLLFIIASLILLVAMIGAIILTIHHSDQIKRQDLFSQIATEYNKTVFNCVSTVSTEISSKKNK
jgi:NADH-quinone oxidoreductase subunit J